MPSWRGLEPRRRVLVRYAADQSLWHERFRLEWLSGGSWLVVSPDRDRFILDLRGPSLVGMQLVEDTKHMSTRHLRTEKKKPTDATDIWSVPCGKG